ncbi:MAG: DUF3857 domain-containing protein [Bacteroidota bacterium]
MLFLKQTKQKTIILAIAMIFAVASAFGQSGILYNTIGIPAQLKSRANAVVRNSETNVDMRNPENVVLSVKTAITVLNENGKMPGALALYYDKNTEIKFVKGAIFDASGTQISKFSLSDFLDHSAADGFSLFIDSRVKYFSPVITAYPYTITYVYEVRHKQNLNLPDWFPGRYSDVAVQHSSFVFTCSQSDKIRIKEHNYIGTPSITKTDKAISYKWSADNISAFKIEPFAPDPDSYLTYVKIAAEKFTYYGYKGTYTNWEQLGKWIYDDLIADRQALDPVTAARITQMIKGLSSKKEQARKIYEYLQKKTRYVSVQVGIGGYRPFPATDVDKFSYGDCKALVNYMQSLLKVADIESYYCVVNAGDFKKSIDPEFATMDQGNHIILCLPFEKDTTWLECTDQNAPFGYLGTFTDDRYVLACTPKGGKVLRTPILSADDNTLRLSAMLELKTDGNIQGNFTTNASGAEYQAYQHLAQLPYTEQIKQLKEDYEINTIDFQNFKLEEKKSIIPAISTTAGITIERYVSSNNGKAYLIPNIFNRSRSIPELRNRLLPLYINRGLTSEDEIVYELPKGYEIEYRPNNVIIDSQFGKYSATIELIGRKLTYHRKLHLLAGNYPAETYVKYSNFLNEISAYDHSKIILKSP